MTQKKLAVLLTAAVMLGQPSFLTNHLAQASSQVPGKVNLKQASTSVEASTETLSETFKVASINQRHTPDIISDDLLNAVQPPQTPDLYMIGAEPGKLRTLIQVLPQDADYTSLFVNGSEILRFHGTVAEKTSYERVKAIADTLSQSLIEDAKNGARIKPDASNQSTLLIGGSPLADVDGVTAKSAQESPEKLAFIYANRLRRALGQLPLPARKTVPDQLDDQETASYQGTGKRQAGMASWYGNQFHGRRTASGSRFNQYGMTAAHRTLPFGTLVRVVNQRNHKSCIVKITDRGPYAHGRIIDLSKGAARVIGMPGVTRVSLEIVNRGG